MAFQKAKNYSNLTTESESNQISLVCYRKSTDSASVPEDSGSRNKRPRTTFNTFNVVDAISIGLLKIGTNAPLNFYDTISEIKKHLTYFEVKVFSSELFFHEYPTEFFVTSGCINDYSVHNIVIDICYALLLNYNLGI